MSSSNMYPNIHGAVGLATLIHPASIIGSHSLVASHNPIHFSLASPLPLHGLSHVTPYTKKISNGVANEEKNTQKSEKQSLRSITYFIFSTAFILMTALAWNKSITEVTIQDVPMNFRIAQWLYTIIITLATILGMYFFQPQKSEIVIA